MTDFGGKTSIFSHPVYLFIRKFCLQDFRGGSVIGDGCQIMIDSNAKLRSIQMPFCNGPNKMGWLKL
ncbi:hypothetical protein D9S17_25330 [Escherichia coli]|nr:hypothetical protein [Escherichia coli]EEV7162548.1 hypothetical protein [Escherichia coli]EEW0750698.1 hypothetical protein [Escherichia coli]EEW4305970.1 hypothetical protein [Escherichia coli]EEW4351044.1 hypothetical protein [Escherichia coli]